MFHSGIYQNTDFALLIIFKDFKKLDHSLDEQVFCFKNNINRSIYKSKKLEQGQSSFYMYILYEL